MSNPSNSIVSCGWRRGASAVAVLAALASSTGRMSAAPSPSPSLDWLFDGLVSSTTRIGNTLYVAGSFNDAGPSSGVLGHLFQLSPTTGAPQTGLPEVNGQVRVIASDGGGGFHIAGPFTNIGSAGLTYPGVPSGMRTAHVLANGSVDSGFSAQFGGDVLGMLRAGPSLVVFGRLYIDAGTTARAVLAVDPTTGALSPWVPSLPGLVSRMATANGVLFVLTSDATRARRVSAFDATSGAPLWTSAVISSTAVVVDAITTVGTRVVVGVDRLYSLDAATGAIDPAWGGPASPADSWTGALAVIGSTIYVTGRFSSYHGQARANLAAVDAASGAVLPWSPQATSEFADIGVSPSGAVFVATWDVQRTLRVNGETRRAGVFEIDASGAVTAWESQVQGPVATMLVTTNGTVVLGAYAPGRTGTVTRAGLVGFDTMTGVAIQNTATLARAGTFPPIANVVSVGQTLYLSGAFDAVNGQPRVNLAAVEAVTNTVLPWPAPGVPTTASILLAHGGWIYVHPNPSSPATPLRRISAVTGVLDPVWSFSATPGATVSLFVARNQLHATRITTTLDIGRVDTTTGELLVDIRLPAADIGRAANPVTIDGDTLYIVSPAHAEDTAIGTLRAFDLRTGRPVSAPNVAGQLNGVAVADGRLFINGGSFAVAGTARGGLGEIARPGTVTPWTSAEWTLTSGFCLSCRGVTDVAARGDVLVAYGIRGAFIRVVAFPLSGATTPTNLRALEAGANTVFTWDAMPGPPAGGYVIEGGFAPGQTAGALPVGNATSVALPIAAGPAFIRVRAQGSTEVSNEVVAGCVAPPLPPTALTTTLNGINLTLAWTAPSGPVTGYTLLAGTASGLSNAARLALGPQTSVSGPVPGGTFFARVTASNACGTSAPSGEVFFTIGAADALPAAPSGLTSSVTGSTLTLSWTAPAGPVTGYVLEAGSAPGLANIGAATIGAGTSFVIPGVPAGTYYVRVRAVTSAGSGAPSNDVAVVVP